MKIYFILFLLVTYLLSLKIKAQEGIWIASQMKFVHSDDTNCSHGRSLLVIKPDGTFSIERKVYTRITGKYSTNPTVQFAPRNKDISITAELISQNKLRLNITEHTHTKIIIYELLKSIESEPKITYFPLLNKKGWTLDSANSTFHEWPTILIHDSNIELSHSFHGELIPYKDWYYEINNHSFFILGFEYDGYILEVTDINENQFHGQIYSMPLNEKGYYSNSEECNIKPIKYTVSYNKLE
jgi:hypothetical protein